MQEALALENMDSGGGGGGGSARDSELSSEVQFRMPGQGDGEGRRTAAEIERHHLQLRQQLDGMSDDEYVDDMISVSVPQL